VFYLTPSFSFQHLLGFKLHDSYLCIFRPRVRHAMILSGFSKPLIIQGSETMSFILSELLHWMIDFGGTL
jgi:hypothetical protein